MDRTNLNSTYVNPSNGQINELLSIRSYCLKGIDQIQNCTKHIQVRQ